MRNSLWAILFLLRSCAPALAQDSIRPAEVYAKHEPYITVERYDANQFKNDPSVLVSFPKQVIAQEQPQVVVKTVYRDRVVIDRPEEPVIVMAKYEED